MPTSTETRHVIAVQDLAASAAHYRDVLGFDLHDFAHGWQIFKLGAFVIQAGECRDEVPAADTGDHSYFAYVEVDDIDAYFARVQAPGARLRKTLRDESWGMREFAVETIDGHRIMFGMEIE